MQQKLQQKFAAQRHKDMLAMQASKASKAAEKSEEPPNAHSVPKPKTQSRKELSTQGKRKRGRQIEKVALNKKAVKRSKQKKAKAIEVPLNEVAEISTAPEPQTAEESSTSIKPAARQSRETPGAKPKEANDNDSKRNIAGAPMATAQKLDDIMDILESSKNQKKSRNPVKVVRRGTPSAKSQATIMAAFNELQNKGESPDVDPAKAAIIMANYSSQLLAHLKANPEEMSGSLHQLRVILHIPSDFVDD